MADIRVNDVGTELVVEMLDEVNVPINIAAATTLQISLKSPGPTSSTTVKTAELDDDGTDGLLKYVTQDGDLSSAGSWSIQGYAVVAGKKWHSPIFTFLVKANL